MQVQIRIEKKNIRRKLFIQRFFVFIFPLSGSSFPLDDFWTCELHGKLIFVRRHLSQFAMLKVLHAIVVSHTAFMWSEVSFLRWFELSNLWKQTLFRLKLLYYLIRCIGFVLKVMWISIIRLVHLLHGRSYCLFMNQINTRNVFCLRY